MSFSTCKKSCQWDNYSRSTMSSNMVLQKHGFGVLLTAEIQSFGKRSCVLKCHLSYQNLIIQDARDFTNWFSWHKMIVGSGVRVPPGDRNQRSWLNGSYRSSHVSLKGSEVREKKSGKFIMFPPYQSESESSIVNDNIFTSIFCPMSHSSITQPCNQENYKQLYTLLIIAWYYAYMNVSVFSHCK